MLINQKKVKEYILTRAKTHRSGWDCSQVSKQVLLKIDGKLRKMLDRAVQQHPSRGRTFRDIL